MPSPRVYECLSECPGSQNTHARATGLHLELHVFTVQLVFIHLSGTKRRAMTGKTRTQLALSPVTAHAPSSSSPRDCPFLVFPVIKIQQQQQELLHYFTFTSHSDLAHLPSRSSFSSPSRRLRTYMNQYIHPQSFTDIMLIIPEHYHC